MTAIVLRDMIGGSGCSMPGKVYGLGLSVVRSSNVWYGWDIMILLKG
jgi:hypothetical protein